MNLGQGQQPITGPSVHTLRWYPSTYDEETLFGEIKQRFDVLINVNEFERVYGPKFNIHIGEVAHAIFGEDIGEGLEVPQRLGGEGLENFGKFHRAIEKLYGIVMFPEKPAPLTERRTSDGRLAWIPPPDPNDPQYEGPQDRQFRMAYQIWERAYGEISEEYAADLERLNDEYQQAALKKYRDHSTEIPLLMSEDEMATAGLSRAPLGIIRPVYNYLLLDYENILESKVKPAGYTHAIPNLYTIMLEAENVEQIVPRDDFFRQGFRVEGPRTNEDFLNFTTVGGLIEKVRPSRLPLRPGGSTSEQHLTFSQKQYFCSWTKAVNRVFPLSREVFNGDGGNNLVRAGRKFFNAFEDFAYIIIPPEQLSFVKGANQYKRNYPMYNELRFQTDPRKTFGEIFKDSKLSTFIMREASMLPPVPYLARHAPLPFNTYTQNSRGWSTTNRVLRRTDLRSTDVTDFWSRFDETGEFGTEQDELLADRFMVLLGSNEEQDVLGSSKWTSRFARRLLKYKFLEGMRTAVKDNLRSYEELLSGELATSETVFYRIEKKLNGDVVQEFFVPNTEDVDIFEYIDTQVMYGASVDADDFNVYEYEIYAGQLIIGSEYQRAMVPTVVDRPPEESAPPSPPPSEPGRSQARPPGSTPAAGQEAPGSAPDQAVQGRSDPMSKEEERLRREEARDTANFFAGLGMTRTPGAVGDLVTALSATGVSVWSGDPSKPSGAPGLPPKDMYIQIAMNSRVRPSLQIVQVPIFKTSPTMLLDKPPASPVVDFVPYRAVDDKLLINMNEQANTHVKALPISFNSKDESHFFNVATMQLMNGLTSPDADLDTTPIIFGNDDFAASFEVYRLSNPPASYQDFANALYHIADLRDESKVPIASSAGFKDALVPNQKYYYTFRVKDIHGHFSNPTEVYQIELVNNGGAIYLLLDVYDFPEESAVTFSKDVRRYIKIQPSLLQGVINMERSNLLDATGAPVPSPRGRTIHLGPDAATVWGKRLKFRLVSKKTGRKIDINVKFKTKQNSELLHPLTGDDKLC
tara:strand:- start:3525 stop:6617 length:3093 start_codon:yes stop_codon:yes gene_type:complete